MILVAEVIRVFVAAFGMEGREEDVDKERRHTHDVTYAVVRELVQRDIRRRQHPSLIIYRGAQAKVDVCVDGEDGMVLG